MVHDLDAAPASALLFTGAARGQERGAQRVRKWDTRRRVMRAEVVEVWERRGWTTLALCVVDTATGQK